MTERLLTRRRAALTATVLGAALVLTACAGGSDDAGDSAGASTGETRSVTADNGTVEVPVGKGSRPLGSWAAHV